MKIKQFKGKKEFEIANFKAVEENGKVVISGYANTKGIADLYGDIPTAFNRSYVYDIAEYLKNPIVLLDHEAEVKKIAGKCIEIYEDEKGLFFRAELSSSDLPEVKHARVLIQEGILKTVSIGGIWLFEDLENPDHLTLAKIFEISLVAIPADPYATFEQDKGEEKKQAEKVAEKAAPDYGVLKRKLTVYELKSKITGFEVKNQKPATSGKEH